MTLIPMFSSAATMADIWVSGLGRTLASLKPRRIALSTLALIEMVAGIIVCPVRAAEVLRPEFQKLPSDL